MATIISIFQLNVAQTSIRTDDSGLFVLLVLCVLALVIGVHYIFKYRQQIRTMIENYMKQYYNMLSREE